MGLIEAIERRIRSNRYREDPVAYGEEVCGLTFTKKQKIALAEIVKSPHRLMIKSANNVGKSWLSAYICKWFYETRDPSNTILTAPTFQQVNDVTFKEIRRLMPDCLDFLPKAPRCTDHIGHLMTGLTAGSDTAFQGRREASNLIVFEECMGIGAEFWTAARFMLSGGYESYWISILNPTDNTGHAYVEEMSGAWAVISISAFEHPNIIAELAGLPPPIPAAVRLGQLKDNMESEGTWVDDPTPLDVDTWSHKLYELDESEWTEELDAGVRHHFPRRYWRPSPVGEARILGRYPTQSSSSVFSDAMFDLSRSLRIAPDRGDRIQGGCDVARFGDDMTAIHFRVGNRSLEHVSYQGQDTRATANHLKKICKRLGTLYNQSPYTIRVNIDDSGVGGGVYDQRITEHDDGTFEVYNFTQVNNGSRPAETDRFPLVRDELLFTLAERMASGSVDLSELDDGPYQEIRRQAVQLIYSLDARARRRVEAKEKIKKRIGRSPDDLDAVALCYYEADAGQITGVRTVTLPEPTAHYRPELTPSHSIPGIRDPKPGRERRRG